MFSIRPFLICVDRLMVLMHEKLADKEVPTEDKNSGLAMARATVIWSSIYNFLLLAAPTD